MTASAGGARLQPQQVAVGIPAYERPDLTERCVESIERTSPSIAELIVADDGSESTATRKLLAELGTRRGIRVLRSRVNQGPAAAKNRIVASLGQEIQAIAFFDNDIVSLDGWLEAGLSALDGGADLVQPLLLRPDGVTVDRGPNRAPDGSLSAHPSYLGTGAAVDHADVAAPRSNAVVGGTFLVRRAAFDTVGLFDSRLRVGEDYDFSYRAVAAGLRLAFEPSCRLVHDHAFEIGYDLVRSSPADCLRSHWLMLELHGRTLYSPGHFYWYRWLLRENEPMYLRPEQRRASLVRRLRRRFNREWTMFRRRGDWRTLAQALAAARAVARSEGWEEQVAPDA